jgi:glycosyltransferase involved in cell wall biosynthesis
VSGPASPEVRSRDHLTIDVVVPARNEGPTIASVVEAGLGCRHARAVIVVDDGSADGTADLAAAAGAKVVHRHPREAGSKAHAMEAGVAATDADAILFVDGDCLALTSAHLDEICAPFVEGRAAMSLGTFDYGFWNWLVLRSPPTTGERIIPRWVFEAIAPEQLDGYTIEYIINGVVAEHRLPTAARVMRGVTHRTKRDKLGRLEGTLETVRMFSHVISVPLRGLVRFRAYWFYLRGLTVEG